MKLLSVIAAGSMLPCAVGAQTVPVTRDSAWFKPSLASDHAPVCADLLRVEQDAFFSTASRANHERAGFKLIRKMYEEPVADPQVEVIPDSFGQLRLTLPAQRRVIAYFHNNGGCGGACETEQVMVADQVFDPMPSRGHKLPATPLAAGWTLYKSADGEFYALGYPQENLQAYRVAPSLRTELVCEVQLQPADAAGDEDASVRSARESSAAYLSALGSMSQDAGACGTLNANWTRRQRSVEAMNQALYRPWAAGATDRSSQGRDAINYFLNKWAASGVAEHRAFLQYRKQYEQTAADLSRFYQQKFGWSQAQADDAVSRVLQGVLDRAFAFSSSFDRFGREQPLRQAILERQPLDVIKALYEDGVRDAVPLDESRQASQYDSVLNAAIDNPEALQYLLDQKLDPNVANGFGKTPLMYAAQYDQLESARILLSAGADP
ncbi:MAG: ankyrin repeat domain-containing protein, partial [Pseudomonadota bacterium]|nr:ankyrin repeat domain-containing protein [Pseudomonadota bacterium]